MTSDNAVGLQSRDSDGIENRESIVSRESGDDGGDGGDDGGGDAAATIAAAARASLRTTIAVHHDI